MGARTIFSPCKSGCSPSGSVCLPRRSVSDSRPQAGTSRDLIFCCSTIPLRSQVAWRPESLVACDCNAEYMVRARSTWREAGVEEKIELRLAPALETLDALVAEGHAGTFDLAFIDADKGNYANYYERSLVLLRPGGLIAVDNVLWHARPLDPDDHTADTEAMRAFNRKLHADRRVAQSLVPLGDGLALACKLR